MARGSERKKSRPPQRQKAGDGAVPVAVGIILRENRVLVTRRREGTHLAGAWEFPGGAIRPGESPEEALRRELQEEIGIRVERSTLVHRQRHSYAERDVDLHFFLCTGTVGEPRAMEGQETRWVSAIDLEHLETPAANSEIIGMLKDQLA